MTAGSRLGETNMAGALPHPPERRHGPFTRSPSCAPACGDIAPSIVAMPHALLAAQAAPLEQHARWQQDIGATLAAGTPPIPATTPKTLESSKIAAHANWANRLVMGTSLPQILPGGRSVAATRTGR